MYVPCTGTYASGLIGDGSAATSAQLYQPSGIRHDASGNYYICDSSNHAIRMVTASTNIISTIAGTTPVRMGS